MNDINPKLPHYPLDLEPPEGFDIPSSLAALLVGIYQTSDAGEAATLAARRDWIICGAVWQEHPETWVLGMLKDQALSEDQTTAR